MAIPLPISAGLIDVIGPRKAHHLARYGANLQSASAMLQDVVSFSYLLDGAGGDTVVRAYNLREMKRNNQLQTKKP